jgi:hypothetical protein
MNEREHEPWVVLHSDCDPVHVIFKEPHLSGTLNGLGGWSAHQVPNAKFTNAKLIAWRVLIKYLIE